MLIEIFKYKDKAQNKGLTELTTFAMGELKGFRFYYKTNYVNVVLYGNANSALVTFDIERGEWLEFKKTLERVICGKRKLKLTIECYVENIFE